MKRCTSWWRKRSDIDGESILTNCSMGTKGTRPFSWMSLLMTSIDALCIGSKNMMLEWYWKGWNRVRRWALMVAWRCLRDITIVSLTKLFNHIFWSNKIPNKWRSILVRRWTRIREIFKVVPFIEELSWWGMLWGYWSYRASSERNNEDLYEPIWFHARKVNRGSHFINRIWEEAVKGDLKGWSTPKDLTLNRSAWKTIIYVHELWLAFSVGFQL
jgi:hypothetical protein